MLDRVSASASNLINYSLGGGGGWRADSGGAGGSAILPYAPDSAAAGRKVVSLLARVDLLPAAPLSPPPAAIACRAAARQRPAALLSWVAVLNSPSIN